MSNSTMNNTLDLTTVILPKIEPANDQQVLDCLKSSQQYTAFAAEAERNLLIENIAKQLNITVSEDEIQEFADNFRKKNKLYGETETMEWLSMQRITTEDWSKGVYLQLLTHKVKEEIAGENADSYYFANRNACRRVAVSQILVDNLTTAMKVVESIRQQKDSFCALALDFSQGKQSRENGGFAGVKFVAELLPEVAAAIEEAAIGEVLDPVKSKIGYHILRVEKWYPAEFTEVRDAVIDYLFHAWVSEKFNENLASE
jgi:parvulin-like peptidyl-prolyl isomerase